MSEPGGMRKHGDPGEDASPGQPGSVDPAGSPASGTTQRLPVLDKPLPAPATAYNPLDGASAARRFWSARRVPSGIVATLLLAGSGLLLYDIAAVRAGRSALQWRKSLAGDLASRPLNDVAVLAGAAAAAALGLWLLLLAVTPGLRRLLPMRRTHADVRGALHRKAVTLVLRDRAMEVPGVQSAAVHTTRQRVRVRALAHFRELDDVRADLHAALVEGVRDLGLARAPALTVRVARAGRKG